MTVSSSVGRTWTVNKLVDRAYKFAGLVNVGGNANESELKGGREFLEDILDALSAESQQVHALDFEDVTITAAQVTAETYKFAMPARVLDLLDPAMYIPANESDIERADGETTMRLISMNEWHRSGTKSAKGTPTRFYAHRSNTTNILEAWVWPIPDEQGTMRFKIQRHLADSDDGTATLDLQNYWMDYLKVRLAADLAQASSLKSAQGLYARARLELSKAKGKANERPGNRMYMSRRYG